MIKDINDITTYQLVCCIQLLCLPLTNLISCYLHPFSLEFVLILNLTFDLRCLECPRKLILLSVLLGLNLGGSSQALRSRTGGEGLSREECLCEQSAIS